MTEKRFVAIDEDELYYITDTKGLKTLEDYIKEFSKPEYKFTEDEVLENAQEEYWQLIYEASMTATENVNMLNELYEENEKLKDKLFEAEKTLLIETADISDYAFDNVEKDIEELRKEIYGEGDLND